jgi:hypothetical protein
LTSVATIIYGVNKFWTHPGIAFDISFDPPVSTVSNTLPPCTTAELNGNPSLLRMNFNAVLLFRFGGILPYGNSSKET